MPWGFQGLLQIPAMRAELRALRADLKNVQEDLAALETKHERLRGRFYGARRGSESGDPDTPRPETKAEILARMGFVRGGAVVPPKG